ncbi:MAG TPA: hypothetical protein VL123_07495 [Candidatus Udaeobacter sp.]|nr:hypothetical protein [Candidatus Udaeobacter sp.]
MIRPRPTLATVLAASAAAMILAAAIALAGPVKKPALRPAAPARAGTRRAAARHAVATRPVPLTDAQRMELAKTARELEEVGAYTRAAVTLGRLRLGSPADADLDLALALDLARIGRPEGAESLLVAPPLTAALTDTLPVQRRHLYPWERETLWTNGHFDGWAWYVWRARAEVAVALGHWHDARVAAEGCILAHPMSGQEWLVFAIAAGREGLMEQAAAAARFAAILDPTLPEAEYLSGVHQWRNGHAAQAQKSFRAAVALDSTWRVPALAMIRSRLPGAAPDTLPTDLLIGIRAAALLTSPARPKIEEFVQMDESATILRRGWPSLPDSLMTLMPTLDLALPVLVDERGRVALLFWPWMPASEIPPLVVSGIVRSLNEWRFKPAMKNNAPHPVWATVEYAYKPPAPGGSGGSGPTGH